MTGLPQKQLVIKNRTELYNPSSKCKMGDLYKILQVNFDF